LKWTKAFRKAAGKEMVVDTTLTFAAKRHVPTRYSRDLVATTLKTMQRVAEIRTKRERAFYKNRMAGNKAAQRAADRKLVEENQHMLPEVRALLSQTADLETDANTHLNSQMEEEETREKVPILVERSKRRARVAEDAMDIE